MVFSFRGCAFQRSDARIMSGRFSLSLEMLWLQIPLRKPKESAPALTLKSRSKQQDRQPDSAYEAVVFTLCKHGCRMRRFNSNVHHKGGTLRPRAARRRFYGNTRSNRCRLIVARSAWTTGTWHRRGSKRHCWVKHLGQHIGHCATLATLVPHWHHNTTLGTTDTA